jgi:hypothetical protein
MCCGTLIVPDVFVSPARQPRHHRFFTAGLILVIHLQMVSAAFTTFFGVILALVN